jgi:sugar O-acyltransferase (sialic acid O-acetyltransferase NeuD family)
MTRIVIIGAGGHGREVADILRHQVTHGDRRTLVGFVDDSPALQGQTVDGLPVLGGWSWLEQPGCPNLAIVCAVGQPKIMRRLALRAQELGLAFARVVSPLAYISPYATLGQGVVIFPGAQVNTGARLGDYAILNAGAVVSHDTIVGPYSNINPGARLAGNVSVGEGCYIGMGSSIIQGTTIGAWSTVGAAAAVVRDLPANTTAVGVPARIIKTKANDWYEL